MIKNCLGLTALDFKKRFIADIDLWILRWLIKFDCGAKGAAANALANYPGFTAFAASEGLKYISQTDVNNGRLTGDSMNRWLKENIDRILDLYNQKLCEGKADSYSDLTAGTDKGRPCRKRPGPFPKGLTKQEKQALLKVLSDGISNGASTGKAIDRKVCGPYVIGDGSGLSIDGSGEEVFDTEGPLAGLSEDDIESLTDDDYVTVKCFEVRFRVFNYIVPEIPQQIPIITEMKRRNLIKLHNEILLPIYKFYFGNEDDVSCKMTISNGLTTILTAATKLLGTIYSRHVYGECVSFNLMGISKEEIINDLRTKRIPVEYGFLSPINGLTISIPYTYEGRVIKDLYLDSPTNSVDIVTVDIG